ncbi:hypothetical protein D3C75_1100680 [compost metagenome]
MNVDLLPQRYLSDRFTLFIGVITGNFQTASNGFLWSSQIVTSLSDHIPGRSVGAVGKANSLGLGGKLTFGKQPYHL